jgi:hypothetical protein
MIAGFDLGAQQYVELQTLVLAAWSFRAHPAPAILTVA